MPIGKMEERVKIENWKSETTEIDTEIGNLFVTVNLNDLNYPVKLMLNVSKSGSNIAHFADAIGRVLTVALQHSVPLKSLVKELKDVGGNFDPPTLPDAIAIVLDRYAKETGRKTERKKDKIVRMENTPNE